MMAGCLFCERNGQLEDSGIAAVATDPDCRVSVRVVGACLSPEDTGRLRPQTAGGMRMGLSQTTRARISDPIPPTVAAGHLLVSGLVRLDTETHPYNVVPPR